MAAVYFWTAGNMYKESREFVHSAEAYEKAAYCYELEGRMEKAADEYLSASEAFSLAGLLEDAKRLTAMAETIRKQVG